MQDENIIRDFCSKFKCELSILENGEHYFYTEEQLEYYRDWVDEVVRFLDL